MENPIYTTIWGCFTRIGDFTWSCVWLWRISGGQSKKMTVKLKRN